MFWNIKKLNIWFAVSALAMFGVTGWSIIQDWDKSWRHPQRGAKVWEAALTTEKISRDKNNSETQARLKEIDDTLVDAGSKSVALSGTTGFEGGVIAGNPDFVIIEPANTSLGRFSVDMTWSCESSGGTAASAALGYQFAFSTIGLEIPQKLVLRPRFNVTPKRIEWELYGDPRARFTTPAKVTSEGHEFELPWGLFELKGTVLSTGSESASVRLDSLTYDGEDYGDLDTYTLPVE